MCGSRESLEFLPHAKSLQERDKRGGVGKSATQWKGGYVKGKQDKEALKMRII